MAAETADGNDADAVYEATHRLAQRVRAGEGPSLLELVTYRMHGHSESDHQVYVDPKEIEAWAKRDPIDLYVSRLATAGVCSHPQVETMRREAEAIVDEAVVFAENSPEPEPEGTLAHVWSRDPVKTDSPGGA
jgi:pyruvate dehydrogenase E1 component alpha subunit